MSTAFTVVFRSGRRSECEERALVLLAVGISSVVERDGAQFVLEVDSADCSQALSQLESYEAERRREHHAAAATGAIVAAPLASYRQAAVGCVLYAAVLLAVALMIANGVGRLDAFERGTLDGAAVQAGQWWRAWTALTLHLDAEHLLANLAAGCWFGYLASRQLGSGTAWLLTVSGAAAANLLEALLGPPAHRAVGASTAVFAALGLLAAHAWRTRLHLPLRWPLRWGPLIGGTVLLGWLGSAGENTDLVGHAAGFVIGALLGAAAAMPTIGRALVRVPQWLAGLAALGCIAIAWACALAG